MTRWCLNLLLCLALIAACAPVTQSSVPAEAPLPEVPAPAAADPRSASPAPGPTSAAVLPPAPAVTAPTVTAPATPPPATPPPAVVQAREALTLLEEALSVEAMLMGGARPAELESLLARAAPAQGDGLAQGVLARVNSLRASGYDCGGGSTGRVPPLAPHEALFSAARLHNEDMVRTGNLSHQGADGQGLAARLERVGYGAMHRGENIASFRSIDAAFRFWLSSAVHCRSIMSPDYVDIGVSVIRTELERYYLTLVFGSPR